VSEQTEIHAWLEAAPGQRTPVRGSCSLGRARTNDVVLPDVNVSRRHAVLHQQDAEEFWIVDLGSANGTYVNSRRINQPLRLNHLDRIEIGPHAFVFHHPNPKLHPHQTESTTEKTIQDIKAIKSWLLVADIEDCTHLIQELPPDEAPRITGRWLATCKQIIEDESGTINKFLGDGFFAYWRDSEVVRPCVASALKKLHQLQNTQDPRFRVVLHYGVVFVGGGGSLGEESLMSNEVNFVFRMEKVASGARALRLLSQAAHENLHPFIPTSPHSSLPVPGFEGEFQFYSFLK